MDIISNLNFHFSTLSCVYRNGLLCQEIPNKSRKAIISLLVQTRVECFAKCTAIPNIKTFNEVNVMFCRSKFILTKINENFKTFHRFFFSILIREILKMFWDPIKFSILFQVESKVKLVFGQVKNAGTKFAKRAAKENKTKSVLLPE